MYIQNFFVIIMSECFKYTSRRIKMKASDYIKALEAGKLDGRLLKIYGGNTEDYRKRYKTAIEEFEKIYGRERDIELFSVASVSGSTNMRFLVFGCLFSV